MGIGSQARLPFRTESIPYLCDRNRAFTKNNGVRRTHIHDGRRGALGQFSGIYNKIYVRNGLSQLCQNTFYRMLRLFATSVGTRPRVWLAECTGKFKRSEEHTSELQSQFHLLFPLLLLKKK